MSAYHCWFFSLCLSLSVSLFLSLLSAASSFSFCRASLEHTVSAEELSYQLPRRAGGSNLTWHDGRGQRTAHTRTVKLLQQPGTEGIQVYWHPTGSSVKECFHCMWMTFRCVFAQEKRLQIVRVSRSGNEGALRIGRVGPLQSWKEKESLWGPGLIYFYLVSLVKQSAVKCLRIICHWFRIFQPLGNHSSSGKENMPSTTI